ncbi:hypothetical protein [Brevibacillus fortis]|uniref:hypothetical protein n=1 Tax=Brevibacillus fortis TaxID=2126352 RepID=UPI0038FD34E7
MNSYKRMQPGTWAPAHVCYGSGNRSVLVRIPEIRRASRFEFRGASWIPRDLNEAINYLAQDTILAKYVITLTDIVSLIKLRPV